MALSRRNGIKYGIAANCGLKFPITDDRGIEQLSSPASRASRSSSACRPKAASGRGCSPKQAIAKFDYVFTDAMTIVDHRGRRARLWIKDEVDIPDKQAFMELLVRTIVEHPQQRADRHLRQSDLSARRAGQGVRRSCGPRSGCGKVIDAAARNGVAIEISNRLRLPKPAFIKQAKRGGHQVHLRHQQRRPQPGPRRNTA